MALNDFVINYGALNGSPEDLADDSQYQAEINESIYNRLCQQFKDRENIRKVLEIFAQGLGPIKAQLYNLKNLRSLATATGEALDFVGWQINVYREGRGDTEYRKAIYLQTLVGASNGTREDIITITKLQTDGDVLRYWDVFPAAFQIFSDGEDSSLESAELIQSITPAGVSSKTELIASHGQVPFVLSESLTENPTLALENNDDYISEDSELLELNVQITEDLSVEYGGSFGETDASTDESYNYLGSPVGSPLCEVYQVE